MRRLGPGLALIAVVAMAAAAVGAAPAIAAKKNPYPLDGVLHLQDVQVLGTHNSYHLRPEPQLLPLEPADYTHPPLDVQLSSQGIRSLEIDVFDEPGIPVLHSIIVDDQSNCPARHVPANGEGVVEGEPGPPAGHDLRRDEADPREHEPDGATGHRRVRCRALARELGRRRPRPPRRHRQAGVREDVAHTRPGARQAQDVAGRDRP